MHLMFMFAKNDVNSHHTIPLFTLDCECDNDVGSQQYYRVAMVTVSICVTQYPHIDYVTSANSSSTSHVTSPLFWLVAL
jgi:hypothetical protein